MAAVAAASAGRLIGTHNRTIAPHYQNTIFHRRENFKSHKAKNRSDGQEISQLLKNWKVITQLTTPHR
jgi:cyclopropane fatty-acyl-phospholipid synthase-like methyltransferase